MPSISGWASGEPVPAADINTYLLRGSRNALINGDARINQRGSATYADDTYFVDRWTVLADGTSMDAGNTNSSPPTDGLWSAYLRPLTNGKKFGMIQFVEQLNCVGMFGQMVTLSFKARVSSPTNLPNIKAGILSWSGTADTLTSDVVSAWGASGTTPTLVANWTFENTPSNLGVTSTWATYRVQGLVDTASVKNVAAFIWSDSTASTTSDYLYVTDVQLEIGAIATPFERRSMAEELVNCQRYYEKSYAQSTAPGTATDVGFVMPMTGGQQAGTSGIHDCYIFYRTEKRASTTVVIYDISGNVNKCRRTAVGVANYENQDVRDVTAGHSGVYFRSASGSGSTNTVSCHYTASAEL